MNRIAFATLGVSAITASAWGQMPAKPDERTLSDTYIYLLGRALTIRQEHIDRRGDRFACNAAITMFNNADLIGVDIFDDVDAKLSSALDVAPNAAEMQQKVRAIAAYVASSKEAHAAIDAQLRGIISQFKEDAFTKTSPNHWLCASTGGNCGAQYRRRTAVNFAGIWANGPSEVVYFIGTRDANERPLNGSNSYVMHFPADKLPDSVVDAIGR